MKKLNFLSLFFFLTTIVSAQVKLNLSVLPDGKTYQVSMIPETTWESPKNITGSAQITIAVPSEEPFLVKNLESKIQGVTWLDNSYVEQIPGVKGWQFVSFALKELGTKAIPFQAGVETPLFTFRSSKSDCAEGILLLDNDDSLIQAVVKNNFNVTQSMTVLGMRGNAISGILNHSVNCPDETPEFTTENWISEVKASPLPASTYVDFSWVNQENLETLELNFYSEQGQLVQKMQLSPKAGHQKLHVELDRFSQGVYSATFVANRRQKKTIRLTVMP